MLLTEATLIFPHQLFREHPGLAPQRPVYLLEEYLFFRQYRFHRQKLMLHRASMRYYANWLQAGGYTVEYIHSTAPEQEVRQCIRRMAEKGIQKLWVADPADDWLQRRLMRACRENNIQLALLPGPGFLNQAAERDDYCHRHPGYFQTRFYMEQRRQRRLLLDPSGKPLGGRWSFDQDNRLKFPRNQQPPLISFPAENEYVQEAREYVNTHFAANPGSDTPFRYPVTHAEAHHWLNDFIRHRLEGFGPYEDAIVAGAHYLHHSLLSPLINTGLLTPAAVLEQVLQAENLARIPLASLEGFVRQITGWREFIRLVYDREGRRQRTSNFWQFSRKIPPAFYSGQTGLLPLDNVIRKVLATGYCHHIERLMVLGNFMLLCEFDPDEVYRWFMELFIDAYDWVMVPNVYGMSQFADGGLMTTKPYLSGSNYLLRMSDYPKGPWCETWDALFWRFLHRHRSFFSTNPRLGMLLKTFDKMPAAKQQLLLTTAEAYLQQLDHQNQPANG